MSSMERLKEIREQAITFHKAYVAQFKSHLEEEKLNKFRLYYLNIITEELDDFFNDGHKIQLLINTLQVGFNIWKEINFEGNITNDIFIFFFVASCFLIVKLECPEKIKKLKNWACNHCIDMNFVFWAERIILNRSNWDLYLDTPTEIIEIISNDFMSEHDEAEYSSSVKEFIGNWIQFAMTEFSIYKKYNQLTITIASMYIGLCQHTDVTKQTAIDFVSYIENTNIVDIELIKNCSNCIITLIQSSDDTKQDNDINEIIDLSPKLERVNSFMSLKSIFTQIDPAKQSTLEQEGLLISASNEFIDETPKYLGKKRKSSLEITS